MAGGGGAWYHRAGDGWAAGFGVVYVAHLRREVLQKERKGKIRLGSSAQHIRGRLKTC